MLIALPLECAAYQCEDGSHAPIPDCCPSHHRHTPFGSTCANGVNKDAVDKAVDDNFNQAEKDPAGTGTDGTPADGSSPTDGTSPADGTSPTDGAGTGGSPAGGAGAGIGQAVSAGGSALSGFGTPSGSGGAGQYSGGQGGPYTGGSNALPPSGGNTYSNPSAPQNMDAHPTARTYGSGNEVITARPAAAAPQPSNQAPSVAARPSSGSQHPAAQASPSYAPPSNAAPYSAPASPSDAVVIRSATSSGLSSGGFKSSPWTHSRGSALTAGQPEGGPAGAFRPLVTQRQPAEREAVQGQTASARAIQTYPAVDPANGARQSGLPRPEDAAVGEMSRLRDFGPTSGRESAFASPSMAVPSLTDRARTSFTRGDSRSTISLLQRAVADHPADADTTSLLALAYSRERDYRSAAAAADAGLKASPDSVSLLDAKALALNRLRGYRDALAVADRAVALSPHDAIAHFYRAMALAGLGDRAGTVAALKTAASLSPIFGPYLEAARGAAGNGLRFLFEDDEDLELPPSRPWWALGAAVGGVCALALWLLARRARRGRALAAPAAERPAPGPLAGHYELGREIGAGGMGIVYEGMDLVLHRRVAIKRMREEIRADEHERGRFVREARAVAKLRHPHIVDIIEIIEEEGEVYLVFEYVAGRTLEQWIAGGRLSFAEARALFGQAAAALDYAHAHGVIHRDLKPSNVMVDAEGRARLVDFGVARVVDKAASARWKTGQHTVAGTPPYMAPEQEKGEACKESDVYALAVCLYEALTGERPFGGIASALSMNKLNKEYAPASGVAAGLPTGLDAVFARAFEPAPAKRTPSAGALMRELDAAA